MTLQEMMAGWSEDVKEKILHMTEIVKSRYVNLDGCTLTQAVEEDASYWHGNAIELYDLIINSLVIGEGESELRINAEQLKLIKHVWSLMTDAPLTEHVVCDVLLKGNICAEKRFDTWMNTVLLFIPTVAIAIQKTGSIFPEVDIDVIIKRTEQ